MDRVTCCEGEDPAGKGSLESSFATNCAIISGESTFCDLACDDGNVSDELSVLVACLQSISLSLKGKVLAECVCQGFTDCLGPCI